MTDRICVIDQCDRRRDSAIGMCKAHHARWQRCGDAMDCGPIGPPINNRSRPACSVDGCETSSRQGGMCVKHFRRWAAHGDASVVLVEWDPDKRYRAGYIEAASGCWEWQGQLSRDGYSRFIANGVRVGVHRWAYERFVGPIPDGLVIDHLCSNPRCVRPDHLEPVTQQENVQRAVRRRT